MACTCPTSCNTLEEWNHEQIKIALHDPLNRYVAQRMFGCHEPTEDQLLRTYIMNKGASAFAGGHEPSWTDTTEPRT